MELLVSSLQVLRSDNRQAQLRVRGRAEDILVTTEARGLEGVLLGVFVESELDYFLHVHLPVQLDHLFLRSLADYLFHVRGQVHVHQLLGAVLVPVHGDHLAYFGVSCCEQFKGCQ